jgi:hypothetical protein
MDQQTKAATNTKAALDFLEQVFSIAKQPVFLCSLANEKNDPAEPTERHVATRDCAEADAFISKWDRAKRGVFFCVSTIKATQKRNKDGVAEICFLHADIDFKDVDDDPDTILRRLKALRLPPSLIVSSGNGYHVYWCLNEALVADDVLIERIEAALKLLCDLVGGDMLVTQVAALMRLPGTHNTKRGEWKDVVVVDNAGGRYELDDIEELLFEASPIVLRKLRPAPTPGQINPYLDAAKAMGMKPPIDVEQRLTNMVYMGGDEASIHKTQISVSASLLNAGIDVEEIVTLLLDATRAAAGEYGKRWNWKREEKEIRKACATWLVKHPSTPKPIAPKPALVTTATVHQLADARPKEVRAKSQKVIDRENMHVVIGQSVINVLADNGTPIMVVGDQLWCYEDGLWLAPDHRGRNYLDLQIETCIRALGTVTSGLRLVAEVRGWIFRNPDISHGTMRWDDHGKIAVRGGLIDPVTLEFVPADPAHHVTARIDCDYLDGAECPTWLTMLDATFADRTGEMRPDTIGLIQEIFGAALIEEKSKALSRALIFQGASNTGKTDLIKTISGLLTDRPISTPFSALDGTHGLMEFARKAPWVLHEAFNSGKWHLSDIVKSILSGDPVQINIKNGAVTTQRIRQPIFWATNFPPQFKEATRAIINRMIVIHCNVVFDPKVPVGVAVTAKAAGYSEPSELILATEKSGLLNWALVGLRRALERGHFKTTEEVDATLEAIRADSNLVAGFLEECVSYDPGYMISTSDFCAAFSVYWTETKGEDRRTPSNESIGKALVAFADPRIGVDGMNLRDNKRRYYAGVHLNGIGLEYWKAAKDEGLAGGKTARISDSQGHVNQLLPPGWSELPVILKLKRHSETVSVSSINSTETELSRLSPIQDKTPRF